MKKAKEEAEKSIRLDKGVQERFQKVGPTSSLSEKQKSERS